MIVWWMRARRCQPSRSSTFCDRCHATFVGFTWNSMNRMSECRGSDVAEIEPQAPVVARLADRRRLDRVDAHALRPARVEHEPCIPEIALRGDVEARLHEVAAANRGGRVDATGSPHGTSARVVDGRWPKTSASPTTRRPRSARAPRAGTRCRSARALRGRDGAAATGSRERRSQLGVSRADLP